MKRKLLTLFMCFALVLTSTMPALAAESDVTVTIYSTNDIHGVVEESDTSIGLLQVAAIAADDPNSILVDAGDATQGSSFATISEGESVIKMMNAAGYDVMAAGNHEFDYGMDQLLSNAKAADFPILSANMTYNGKHVLPGHEIVTSGGKAVGFIGLTTASTISNANPAGLAGIAFEEELAAAKREIAEIADETDAIILICHMGDNEAVVKTTSRKLLDGLTDKELSLVTAVIDGHSHTLEDGTPYVRGNKSIPIIQTGTQLSNLGSVTLSFSNDTVSAQGKVMAYEDAKGYSFSAESTAAVEAARESVTKTLTQIKGEQDKILNEKLIENLVPVWGGNVYWDYSENRIVETAYGDLVTDAFAELGKEYAEAQGLDLPVIALENGGGIAQPMYQGTVTYGDILGAFNHGNTVEARKVTPAQLYEALEVGLTMTGQDQTGLILRERVSGSFLQVSGFTYTYDPAGESGSKVTDVTLDSGVSLKRGDNTTQLLLATTNYVAGFSGISGGEKLGELGGEDMAVRDWLMALTKDGTIPLNYPVSANRIRYANDKSPDTYTVSIPVLDEYDHPLENLSVHINVDGSEYKEYVTDKDGLVAVTVSKGPHAIGLKESGGYVYVNNYSGSGTVTTKKGYCEFAFHVETGESPFVDVAADNPYYDAITTVFRAGLMSGVGNNRFDTESFTSRAMTVQILYVLSGKTSVDSPITWNDIAEDAWYAEAVHWASSKKVASGYSTDTFGPADIITREQLAVMVYQYESTLEGFDSGWTYTMEGFSDTSEIAGWADKAMRWCVMKGIFTGEDGKLSPKSKLNRGELAQIFANLIAAD